MKRKEAIEKHPVLYLAVGALAAKDDKQEIRLTGKYLSHFIGWGEMWDKNRRIALEHKAKALKLDKVLRETYPTKNQLDFKNFEKISEVTGTK